MEDASEIEEKEEEKQPITSGQVGAGIPDRDRDRRSFFSWFHNWVWNYEDQSVRGSFINIALTIFYVLIIIAGVIWNFAAKNLREMETFLIGFYLVSFGVWATKKTVEFVKFTNAENIVNSVLGKVGITTGSRIQDKAKIKVESAESKPEDKQ